jgi:hypothetical protein
MMLRVAKIPSLNVDPDVIDAVAEELRGGDKIKEGNGVLRIRGREGRAYLFLLSEDVTDDLSLNARNNCTGKCPS